MLIPIVGIYLTVAASTGAYVFYKGVLNGPSDRLLGFAEHATLTVASLVVGTLWVLFVPALLIVAPHNSREAMGGRFERLRRKEMTPARAR